MFRITDLFILIGFIIIFIGIMCLGVVYGQNATNITSMNLDCLRMFYSDEWNKGYVSSLAEFCNK